MAKKKKNNKGRRKNAARPERNKKDAMIAEEICVSDAAKEALVQGIHSAVSNPDYVPDPNLVRGLAKSIPNSVFESRTNDIMEREGGGWKQALASATESALNSPKAELTDAGKQALARVMDSATNHPDGVPNRNLVLEAIDQGVQGHIIGTAVRDIKQKKAPKEEAAVARLPPKQKPPKEEAAVAKPKPINQDMPVKTPEAEPLLITAEFSGRLGICDHLRMTIPNEVIFCFNNIADVREDWHDNLLSFFGQQIRDAMPETKHPERILPILSELPLNIKGNNWKEIPVQGAHTLKKFIEAQEVSRLKGPRLSSLTRIEFILNGWDLTIPAQFDGANFDEVSLLEYHNAAAAEIVQKWEAMLETPGGMNFQKQYLPEALMKALKDPVLMLRAIPELVAALSCYLKTYPSELPFAASFLQEFHPYILVSMELHPFNRTTRQEFVLQDGCVALQKLAQWQVGDIKPIDIATFKTVRFLASTFRKHLETSKEKVALEACRVLDAMAPDPTAVTNVVPDDMTTWMMSYKTNGLRHLLRAMDDYMEQEDFLVLACRTLTKLTLDAHVTLMYFWRFYGIETIALAMVRYPSNEELQEHACRVLERLTRWEELQVLEALSLEKGVNILLAAIDNFPRNKKVLNFGGATIFRLKDFESGRLSRPSLRDID